MQKMELDLALRALCLVLVFTVLEHRNTKNIETVIGIDLGATYSCVGVLIRGHVEIIPNDQGNRLTPSYVSFTSDGERLFGDAANNHLTTNPENTIFHTKRLIGRKWSDLSVQNDIKLFPFKVVEKNFKPYISVRENLFAPEEISAMVLRNIKETAEAYLRRNITHAVVAVPAHFSQTQRQATMDAGTIAGLNIIRIINEPTAAALAYGWDQHDGIKTVLVFDLGGTTFDVSLLTIDNGVFDVLATNGDSRLGGEDFNQRVVDHFINLYQQQTGKYVRKDIRAVQKLRREVERAKRALSSRQRVRLQIESFFDGYDFSETLTRAKFEELNMDLFRYAMKLVQKVLNDAKLSKKDVDEIVLVGGSTRLPIIQVLLKNFFNGKEPCHRLNIDEAVAYGAALQAGVLSGEQGRNTIVRLSEVKSLSVGIKTEIGVMTKVIPRNTVIPTNKTEYFSTAFGDQISMYIFEGEHSKTKHNHLLGKLDLTTVPRVAPDVPLKRITFEIDASGVLQLSTEDGERLVITNQNVLTPEDIEGMTRDAEKFADYDKKVKKRVEARYELESYVYFLRNQFRDEGKLGSKVFGDAKKKMEEAIEEKIYWLKDNQNREAEVYKKEKNKLEDVIEAITEKLSQGLDEDDLGTARLN